MGDLNWNSRHLSQGWLRGVNAFFWGLGLTDEDLSTQTFTLTNDSHSKILRIPHEAISLILPDWSAKPMRVVCLFNRQQGFNYNTDVPHQYKLRRNNLKCQNITPFCPPCFCFYFFLGCLDAILQNPPRTRPKTLSTPSPNNRTYLTHLQLPLQARQNPAPLDRKAQLLKGWSGYLEACFGWAHPNGKGTAR